jgi:uncharacterized membrane protein YqaE (UPF0057 family)
MDIQIFIHLFDGTITTHKVNNNISLTKLIKLIKQKHKIQANIKVKSETKLLQNNLTLDENNIKNNDNIHIYSCINGGFIDTLMTLLEGMKTLFINIGDILKELMRIFSLLIELIPNIFKPDILINDIIYGVTTGISTMINAFIDNILNIFSEQEPPLSNDIYNEPQYKKVCIKPTILNLIILVLCPPLAILRSKGIRGFLLIVICAILTYYMYYFPGLLFAALHTLC